MSTDQIGWDENGNLHLPEHYAYIGVAMDRRDAADEIQWAFDEARRARVASLATTTTDPRRTEAAETPGSTD